MDQFVVVPITVWLVEVPVQQITPLIRSILAGQPRQPRYHRKSDKGETVSEKALADPMGDPSKA